MPLFSLKPHQNREHFYKRHILVLVSSAAFVGYLILFVAVTLAFDVLDKTSAEVCKVFYEPWFIVLYLLLGIAMGATAFIGCTDGYDTGGELFEWGAASPERSFVTLVINFYLMLALIAIPLFLMGGLMQSPFTAVITMISTLAVVITESAKVRGLVIFTCVALLGTANLWAPVLEVAKPGFFSWLYFTTVASSIGVAYYASRKGTLSLGTSTPDPATTAAATVPVV